MKKYVVYVLAVILGVVFYGSALLKFAGPPAVQATFAHLGLADWRVFIAVLEMTCVTVLLIPRTKFAGLVLMSSYLGGAMVAHLSHGELPFIPTAILGLVWLFSYLRFSMADAPASVNTRNTVGRIQTV
jgi:hypothetical protein